MFPPFPESEALEKCRWLIAKIDAGEIQLRRLARASEERAGLGLMLAAMLATEGEGQDDAAAGSSPPQLFFACSGLSRQLAVVNPALEGKFQIAPPIVPPEEISAALEKNDGEIHRLTAMLREGSGLSPQEEQALKDRRRKLTDESLAAVFARYRFCCADGKRRSLAEVCAEHARRTGGRKALPPTGTGECAGQKLLHLAFSRGLTPLGMAEVFYCGAGSPAAARRGRRAVPCDSRCGIVLPAMLGLEIVYRDADIIIVNKQGGLLSVPGRGPDKQDCVVSRVQRLFPSCMKQPSVHRLDMETSGLMLLAFNPAAQRELSRQFQAGEVAKEYVALVDGVLARAGVAEAGVMELTFRLDVDNRPHQIWDSVYGKKAVTQWRILRVQDYCAPDGSRRPATRVLFLPHTGRTHQLRLAAASSHGFGCPIIGDTLYGSCAPGERLMLHASYLGFTHPSLGRRMEFRSPPPF